MVSKNKRKQTFKEEYSRSWDFIKPSRKGENHARCKLCSADFSIAASGRYDITQHIATEKHRSNAERKMRVIKWGKGSLFVCVFKKYRFLLKSTGLWASKYRFVFPEVGMSVIGIDLALWPPFWEPRINFCLTDGDDYNPYQCWSRDEIFPPVGGILPFSLFHPCTKV